MRGDLQAGQVADAVYWSGGLRRRPKLTDYVIGAGRAKKKPRPVLAAQLGAIAAAMGCPFTPPPGESNGDR